MTKSLKIVIVLVLLATAGYITYRFVDLAELGVLPEYNEYTMVYNEINGLSISNPVVVNGLSVGDVSNLELIQDGKHNRIKVTIEVKKNIKVGDGTTAILQSSDFLGGKMILLRLGPNTEIFPSGREIKAQLERTIAEEMEHHSKPIFDNLNVTREIVGDFYDSIDIARIERTERNFKASMKTIDKMIQDAGQQSGIVMDNLYDLKLGIDETKGGVGKLTNKIDTFRYYVNSLHLKERFEEAQKSGRHLTEMSMKIDSGVGSMGLFMDTTTIFYSTMDSFGNSMNNFILHMDTAEGEFIPLGKKPKKNDPHWDDKRFHR